MAILKTDGIILKTLPFRTSSLIVTFFSKDFGKLKGIAKGVRLERELRGSLFELFTEVEVVYYEKQKSDLHLISEAFILESYDPVRTRIETIAYASYFADLVDQLTEFHDPHQPIFDLLRFAYRYLPTISGEKLCRIFETRLLKEIGWLPYLDACIKCGNQSVAEFLFSPIQGALYCHSCGSSIQDARAISEETLGILRYYLQNEPEESVKLRVENASEQGLASLMMKFFQARLSRPLKSRIFIEKIQPSLIAAQKNLS